MRFYFVLFLTGLTIALLFGCGDNPTDSPGGNGALEDTTGVEIVWSSTTVFYDTIAAKKDYSLIIFEAPWCGYCRLLDEQTLTNPAVISIMNESFNCAKIDIEADSMVAYFDSIVTCRQYAETYGITGIPTTCFLNRSGQLLGKIPGYYPPENYADYLDTIRNGAMGPP